MSNRRGGPTSSVSLYFAFTLQALILGAFFCRVAELQRDLGLSEADFGLALMAFPVGVLITSVFMGRLIDIIGTRLLIVAGFVVLGSCDVLGALAFGGGTFAAAIFLMGAALNVTNIAINVEADRVEASTERRIMNRCHGFWAAGFLFVTLVSTALISLGVTPLAQFLALFVITLGVTATTLRGLVAAPPRKTQGTTQKRRLALPNRGTYLLLGFSVGAAVIDWAARSWSVIFIRDTFRTEDWVASLALPVTVCALTIGRFAGDSSVDRFGPVHVARALSLLMAAGLAIIAVAGTTLLSLVGFAILGFGISIGYPLAFSAAARWGDRPSAENVAALTIAQTVVLIAVPPVFGLMAEALGFRIAFASLLIFPAISYAFASNLAPRQLDLAESIPQS